MLERLGRLSVDGVADGGKGLHVSVEHFDDDSFSDSFFDCLVASFTIEDFIETIADAALSRVTAGVAALPRFPRRKVFDAATMFFFLTHCKAHYVQ
jgi:hypothetical protein